MSDSDESFGPAPTFDNLVYLIATARDVTQILREGKTGRLKAKLDLLYYQLNQAIVIVEKAECGDYDSPKE